MHSFMPNTSKVRHELNKEIARKGYTLSSFSKISRVNRGVLSLTLNEKATKSFSMNQLNQMTKALDFPAGWLYELYTQEILADINNVSWRRIKDLLTHCWQIGKMDLIKMMLEALGDKPAYANYIFHFAEEIADQQPADVGGLAIFYQHVLDHETNLQAERFAISQYRLFRGSMQLDVQKWFRAAIQFASHRHALPTHLQLDALTQLINISFASKDWKLLKQYGEELLHSTHLIYNQQKKRPHSPAKTYERPLVHYYGKSYLVQCAALEMLEEYEEAKSLIPYFSNLSWFRVLDCQGKLSVEKYAVWAMCHYYNIELLQGNKSLLKPYTDYLVFFPEEQHASLEMILKASNKHRWTIDEILIKYDDIIYPHDILDYLSNLTSYSMIVETNRYINIYYELAIYYFERKKTSEQLEKILLALKCAIEKYNLILTFDSTELFKKLYTFYFRIN